MAQEIERKFLVIGDFKSQAFEQSRIVQGYISSARGRTVRVRIRNGRGYLTIKGASNESGTSRYEWEKELSLHEAEELMKLCEPGVIDKTRYWFVVVNIFLKSMSFMVKTKDLLLQRWNSMLKMRLL